ncbi:MAG TPA: 4'-phosphopantetheinyl transferase superfamily protein [Polyangiales bacterium]|nr:4'-phosphopantetheinyl transferase superfamily protein [Polyangiales bacterium]
MGFRELAGLDACVSYAFPSTILEAHSREVLIAQLSDEERTRHARFRFESDRDIYLVAHVLTRRMLSALTGVPAAALEFLAGEHGRPEICAPDAARPYRFNLSHTHGLVACGVTRERDIGVDVELCSRKVELLGVARQVFSPQEIAGLTALEGLAQRERFFELWTLKEAYIKAIGKGLSAPLRSITFEPAASDPVPVRFDRDVADDHSRWCLRRFRVGDEHRLALALAADRSALVHCAEASPEDFGA